MKAKLPTDLKYGNVSVHVTFSDDPPGNAISAVRAILLSAYSVAAPVSVVKIHKNEVDKFNEL